MKDETTSMSHNKVWSLVEFLEVVDPLDANGCSRPSAMLRDKYRDIYQD